MARAAGVERTGIGSMDESTMHGVCARSCLEVLAELLAWAQGRREREDVQKVAFLCRLGAALGLVVTTRLR